MSNTIQSPESVIDREKLLDHVCGNTDLLREIADIFLGNFPNQLAEMRSAIEAKDCGRIAELGHLVKGSLSNFHAPAAINSALQLEQNGRQNQVAEAEASVVRLQQEVQRMSDVLDELC